MRRPAASWTLAALAIGFSVARLVLVIADSGGPGKIAGVATPESHPALAVYETIALALFAATGALVASRRSRNPIGWLLLTTPFWLGVLLVSERLAWHGLLSHGTLGHGVTDWLWVANWAWIPAVVPVFTFVPLLFPTGQPLTQRWRRVGWVTVAAACALLVAYALSPGSLENYPAVENPFSVGRAARPIVGVAYALVAAGALASAVSLALRFRRSHGVERQQLKWVWAAAALLVVSFVLSSAVQGPLGEELSWAIFLAGLLGIPAAVAVAILRYRLYDIAVVVNRTLVYGLLTATLALAYLASVLLLQLVLRPVTEQSNLAVAASTLAVAGLFRPARRRIQEIVDRRFYRRKYDAARELEAFSARLRDEVDLDSLSAELRALLQDTMQPSHVSLWLRPSGE